MSAEFNSSTHAANMSNLLSQQSAGAGGGGAGADSTHFNELANAFMGFLGRLFGANPANPENAGILKKIDSPEGFAGTMQKGAGSLSLSRPNSIGSQLAKFFTREATAIHSAEKEALTVNAPPVETPHIEAPPIQPMSQDMLAGVGPLNLGSGGMHLETGSSVIPMGGGGLGGERHI